jgi:hypothetical protein
LRTREASEPLDEEEKDTVSHWEYMCELGWKYLRPRHDDLEAQGVNVKTTSLRRRRWLRL